MAMNDPNWWWTPWHHVPFIVGMAGVTRSVASKITPTISAAIAIIGLVSAPIAGYWASRIQTEVSIEKERQRNDAQNERISAVETLAHSLDDRCRQSQIDIGKAQAIEGRMDRVQAQAQQALDLVHELRGTIRQHDEEDNRKFDRIKK